MHEHRRVPEVPGHLARLLLVLPQIFKHLWDGEQPAFPQIRCHHSSLCCTLQPFRLSALLLHGGLLAPSSVAGFLEEHLQTLSYGHNDTNVMHVRSNRFCMFGRTDSDDAFAEDCLPLLPAGARSASRRTPCSPRMAASN